MGILMMKNVSQVVINNTWLYYYIIIGIYLGHGLLLSRASLPWQDLLRIKRYALDIY